MANVSGLKDKSSMEFNDESSDSTVEIKIKTLDLQTHSFRVIRNMVTSALKKEIATKIGVPLERQRLLYKGKILKDDKLLSGLNLDDGDTMHLVERLPETSSNQGVGTEGSHNTYWIPLDNPPTNISSVPFTHISTLQNENESIPDALTTLSDYIDFMECSLQRCSNLWNHDQSLMVLTHPRSDDLLDTEDAPTPEYLSFVLDRIEQLLRDNVTATISNLSTRLQRIDSSSNPVLRSQIHFGAREFGTVMFMLGAMLLELGRVAMCLRMGETPEESFVRCGSAAYITRAGVNSAMIQLFPLIFTGAWAFRPAHTETGQSEPTHSASQVHDSTASRGDQHHVAGSPRAPPSESESVEQQASNLERENANEPSIFQITNAMYAVREGGIEQTDSVALLTNAMQSSAFSRLLSALASHYGASIEGLRTIFEDGFLSPTLQNSLSELVRELRMDLMICMIERWVPEASQLVGLMSRLSAPVQGGAESEPLPEQQLGCNYQVDLGQAVEIIEQNGDPRSIFGALLEISVREDGEQNVYQDIVELGNNEELANEFMEVLRRDIRRRLAKESSLMEL